MRQLARLFPPPPTHPAHSAVSALATRAAERDLETRLRVRQLAKKVPSFVLARLEGGAGFPISNLLRDYFRNYAYRIFEHGWHSFPCSFNIVESFLSYSHDYFMFDLREEREHLLRLHDYLDWYTSGAMPEEPGVLTEVAKEGVIYSYNMVEPAGDFRVEVQGSELVISGVGLVRHATELSMVILCGETPPHLSDEEAEDVDFEPMVGKEGLEIGAEYSGEDRYLKEVPGYSRVIGLARVDLASRRCLVRYLYHDVGPSYHVVSDDPTIFPEGVTEAERARFYAVSSKTLARYEPLFATLWSLMYLPAFFIDRHGQVAESTFSTELHSRRSSTEVRRAVRHLGRTSMAFSRKVLCLRPGGAGSSEDELTIVPPQMEHAASGFWKPLPPGQVGEDEDGNPILGKTWVERTDTWSNLSVSEFVVRKQGKSVEGANPGHVYVMRSGSHGLDVYKVGKTGRSPEIRASELTRPTGVPTPFEVLARWEVGDVDSVEREAHRRLDAYRVSRRREFFRAPLSTIVSEVNSIVENWSANATAGE